MKGPTKILAALILAGFVIQAEAGTRSKNVEDWVSSDVAARLSRDLSQSPRYRDSVLRFVVFESGRPAARTNRLELRLRDLLQEGVAAEGRLRTAWDAGDPETGRPLPMTGSDCEAGQADLYAGIELDRGKDGDTVARLRLLDVAAREWTTGMQLEWRGVLSRRQVRDMAEAAEDRSQRGRRSLPFDPDEPDLIARHLAHQLRCQLMRGVSGDYVVIGDAGDDRTDAIVALARNQLGGLSTLSLTAADGRVNAELTGSLHDVDPGLGQYWLTLLPIDPDSDLEPLSASVYVASTSAAEILPGGQDAVTGVAFPAATNDILAGVEPIRLLPGRDCPAAGGNRFARRASSGIEACAAFRIRTKRDAVVFVLNHPLNRGLLRIGTNSCGRLRPAGVARRDEALVVRLPIEELRGDWHTSAVWSATPSADTWYAVAVADSKAARAIAGHVARLPVRCTAAIQPGLDGSELERWLASLESVLARWPTAVDWQALQVRQVY